MSLDIQQTASQAGHGRWHWSVWIDGPDAELDQVESVEWVLHPTFPNPVVPVKQRQTKFRIDRTGWGEFEISANVTAKDGSRQHLKHRLRLAESGAGSAQQTSGERPAVLIDIQQTASQADDGRWHWSVWIDGPDAELDQVESVEWVLHPTFPNPVVLVKQRRTKFRIGRTGWGEFEINANVTAKDGSRQHLKHRLRLAESGAGSAQQTSGERPAVFVSASVADAGWEDAVQDALVRRGFRVLTANDVPAGIPVEAAISAALDKASAVVGIFSDKPGSWAEREVMKAMEKDISVFPIAVGSRAEIPSELQSIQAVRISDLDDVDAAIGQIVNKLT